MGSSCYGSVVANLTSNHEDTWVWFLALLSGLRIWRCCELWCTSQTQLGSQVAVAVAQAGSCSSDSIGPLAQELPYAESAALKWKEKKKKKKLFFTNMNYQGRLELFNIRQFINLYHVINNKRGCINPGFTCYAILSMKIPTIFNLTTEFSYQ